MTKTVINPKTGREINIGGPTYEKLVKEGYSFKSAKKGIRKIPKASVSKELKQKILSKDIPKVKKAKGRGGQTRGWGEAAPKRGRERKELYKQCGDSCFLKPDTLNFPICAKCSPKGCSCKIDPRGVNAAYIRARQWKYGDIADLAYELKTKMK